MLIASIVLAIIYLSLAAVSIFVDGSPSFELGTVEHVRRHAHPCISCDR